MPVYFYGTCMLDILSPYTGYHLVRLLEEAGCQVNFPAGQTCCGQPAYNSGYHNEARKVALAQKDLFPIDCPIILPSGSCAAMMHHHYHDLLPKQTELLQKMNRIEEWSRFYHRLKPDLKDQGQPIRIAWHGSCHSLREMEVEQEPLDLLHSLFHVEVAELPHQRECCGFGGTFAVKYPNISAVMGENKCQEILDTQAMALVSSDVGCMTHILTRMAKLGKRISGYHLADFLASRLGLAHPDYKPYRL